MPKAHQRYANMTPASLIKMAARIGVNAATPVERMMRERPHPEQGYRSAMGIIALARRTNAIGWKRPVSGRAPLTRSITPP
jgi:transposase